MCPAFKVTRDDMKEQSFIAFVKDTFRRHPNLPAFKIIPPNGWNPTQKDAELDGMVIGTPIQQLVRISHLLSVPVLPTRCPYDLFAVFRHSGRQDRIVVCWWNKRCVSAI